MITVSALVHTSPEKAWMIWTLPQHITKWNQASDDWHTPHSEVDLVPGGKMLSRMEAKDGSMGFDFEAVFTEVVPHSKLAYTLADGRKILVLFEPVNEGTLVTESFEPENMHSHELQQQGWQAILNSYKNYAETQTRLIPLEFSEQVNAPIEKVYTTMLDDDGYRQWTAAFDPSSHFVGSWEKGSEICFMAKDENGEPCGMASRIKENIPNSFVSIEHYDFIEKGETIVSGPKVLLWAGALENYRFTAEGNNTTVTVTLDTAAAWVDYFNKTYPLALQKLKEICEQ